MLFLPSLCWHFVSPWGCFAPLFTRFVSLWLFLSLCAYFASFLVVLSLFVGCFAYLNAFILHLSAVILCLVFVVLCLFLLVLHPFTLILCLCGRFMSVVISTLFLLFFADVLFLLGGCFVPLFGCFMSFVTALCPFMLFLHLFAVVLCLCGSQPQEARSVLQSMTLWGLSLSRPELMLLLFSHADASKDIFLINYCFNSKLRSAAWTTASGQMSYFILNIDLTYKNHFRVWIPLCLSVFKPWLLIRQTLQCLAGIFQPAEIILLTDYDTNSISMLLFKAGSIYLFLPRCFDTPSNHSWPLKVEHMNVDLPDYKRLDKINLSTEWVIYSPGTGCSFELLQGSLTSPGTVWRGWVQPAGCCLPHAWPATTWGRLGSRPVGCLPAWREVLLLGKASLCLPTGCSQTRLSCTPGIKRIKVLY